MPVITLVTKRPGRFWLRYRQLIAVAIPEQEYYFLLRHPNRLVAWRAYAKSLDLPSGQWDPYAVEQDRQVFFLYLRALDQYHRVQITQAEHDAYQADSTGALVAQRIDELPKGTWQPFALTGNQLTVSDGGPDRLIQPLEVAYDDTSIYLAEDDGDGGPDLMVLDRRIYSVERSGTAITIIPDPPGLTLRAGVLTRL